MGPSRFVPRFRWQVSGGRFPPPDFLCYEASQSDGLGQHDHRWPQDFFGVKNHADEWGNQTDMLPMYMVYVPPHIYGKCRYIFQTHGAFGKGCSKKNPSSFSATRSWKRHSEWWSLWSNQMTSKHLYNFSWSSESPRIFRTFSTITCTDIANNSISKRCCWCW